ncbi:ATP-binding protein [Cytobacillus sp. S13-E01]|uniref:two-component system histidine kinase PnpS n=1 Tax=Cytobacillus sp. S13-E01 TaxID=3031326 RepID=UPI0023D86F39|nr:ATP-binding protein [Cytobacillus sp. S13-E01]MDF0727500.1 ATP-binding protein [Cytobacillus sp. S13-E01]
MNRFRSRLLFALITLIIIVLVGLGLLLGQMFKSFYLNTFNQRMEKEANLVAIYVTEGEQSRISIPDRMKRIKEALQSRITIIDREGAILYDTDGSNNESDAIHEIQIKNIVKNYLNDAKDFHLIEAEYDMYYYGVPLIKGETIDGYVVLSSPVDSLRKVNGQIWVLLISSLGVAFIVILLLGIRITSQYTKPIEAATKVAIELAKGNYKARTYEAHADETSALSQSINILARNLQDMTKAHEMQQDRLRTLIENMGSGLILIDSRGYINLINIAYKELFDIDPTDYLYRIYYEAIPHKSINSIVEEVFLTEEKVRRQLVLSLNIERRHFEVYGAPIIGTNDEWKGVVLVFHDITELKRLEQMRKDFVANVSHELKTPITSIKGFSETLLDGAMKDEQTLENFLSIILKESDRLQSLIQDLLDLSKTEQQGFQLNIQKVNVIETIQEAIFMLKGKADDKQITLRFDSQNESVSIPGDLYRIKQVFINLINNGIAYTPIEGQVLIEVIDLENSVEISVSDTGIGISEDEITRIFERFYRIDKARSRNSGGTGLGLAIVKHLIEAHQGTITVKSELGKGTTFIVKLKK